MYTIVTFDYNNQASMDQILNPKNLIYRLNYIKENMNNIVIVYVYELVENKLTLKLELDMSK